MNVRDRKHLKPGATLKAKRGWFSTEFFVRVVEYPVNGDPGKVKIRDGKDEYVWTTDCLVFFQRSKDDVKK